MIKVNETGICPHCKASNRFEIIRYHNWSMQNFNSSYNIQWKWDQYFSLNSCRCTSCGDIILFFANQMVYPLGSKRNSAPTEVPTNIAEDFNEACLVESLSKKASAALARRCLQNVLHDQWFKNTDLSKEIDEAMKWLPSYLSDSIDSIRNVWNFAAHPIKNTHTGEILEVEEGESERVLDVLEQLFDFYYIQPAVMQAKRDALNIKLKEAWKPIMK